MTAFIPRLKPWAFCRKPGKNKVKKDVLVENAEVSKTEENKEGTK